MTAERVAFEIVTVDKTPETAVPLGQAQFINTTKTCPRH